MGIYVCMMHVLVYMGKLKVCLVTIGTRDFSAKDDKSFPFNTSALPSTLLSTVTTTTTTNKRKSTTAIPSAVASRDPCDPSSLMMSTATGTVLSLPPPPSASQVPPSKQYPSQHQSALYGGTVTKSAMSGHTTTSSGNSTTGHGSRTRAPSSGTGGRQIGANVKPLSTQERMSMFMEHTIASSNKSTPRIVIRKDANFKSACNKIRWLNKSGKAATISAASKDSTTVSSSDGKVIDNGGQFYSFHEKADPSLDESVNPPIKLPPALLVRPG